MDTYKKLLIKLKMAKIVLNVGPFFPIIAVFAAMCISPSISAADKSGWSSALVLAFIAMFPIFFLVKNISIQPKQNLLNYCAESVIQPMLSKDFSDIEISASEQIGEEDVSVLFCKKSTSEFADQYTDYNDYFGSWLIKGTYQGHPFTFSNFTTTTVGQRRIIIKRFQGIFIKVSIEQSSSADTLNFEKRLNWINPYENTFQKRRGRCYYKEYKGKLYIALDCQYMLFEPKEDLMIYESSSTENMLLLKRILNAAIPDLGE